MRTTEKDYVPVQITGERISSADRIAITLTASPQWWHLIIKEAEVRGMTCTIYQRIKKAVEQLEQNKVEV
jgi:hypothetical protein